jgi:hypothetical protein
VCQCCKYVPAGRFDAADSLARQVSALTERCQRLERNQRRWCPACGKPYADAREAATERFTGGEQLCWMRDKACRSMEVAGTDPALAALPAAKGEADPEKRRADFYEKWLRKWATYACDWSRKRTTDRECPPSKICASCFARAALADYADELAKAGT